MSCVASPRCALLPRPDAALPAAGPGLALQPEPPALVHSHVTARNPVAHTHLTLLTMGRLLGSRVPSSQGAICGRGLEAMQVCRQLPEPQYLGRSFTPNFVLLWSMGWTVTWADGGEGVLGWPTVDGR